MIYKTTELCIDAILTSKKGCIKFALYFNLKVYLKQKEPKDK